MCPCWRRWPKPHRLSPTRQRWQVLGGGNGRQSLRGRGWSNKAIARELGVHASTVGRWFPRTDPAPAADQETSAVPEHHNESDEEKEQKS